MRSPRSALLLVPMLLVGAIPARAQPTPCQAGAPRLELSAVPPAAAALCIHPGQFTTFLFDAPLEGSAVVLEGREHFRVVEASSRALLLVPGESLPAGARLQLEVRFADGQAPERARFTLVAHPERAARQVEVSRVKASQSACQAQVGQLEAELGQCKARLQSAPPPPEKGLLLVPMLSNGNLDATGLTTRSLESHEFSQRSEGALRVEDLLIFRTRRRVTVQLRLANVDPQRPWTLAGATLLGPDGAILQAVGVHPEEPLPPGVTEPRWVEWLLPPTEHLRRYSLQLWDAGKARTVTVSNLKLQ